MPWDETDQYIRSGHRSPDTFQPNSMRTIVLSKEQGIKAIIGKLTGQDTTTIQSYLFSKDAGWTMSKAKDWFASHHEEYTQWLKLRATRALIERMRHPDFERIRNEFIKYYGDVGDAEYHDWLQALNLDETKAYAMSQREKFSFIKPFLTKLREDEQAVYYGVLVGFPLTSMNENPYYKDELEAAAKDLVNAFDCNFCHTTLKLPGIRYAAAKYEDGAVEAVLRVPKALLATIDVKQNTCELGQGRPFYTYIDDGTIVNQSLEADRDPFKFTGSALLTKTTLPGIPLSRIFPLADVVAEALSASKSLKGKRVKLQVTGLMENTQMSQECPTGQHLDAATGQCVPDEGASTPPQGTTAQGGTGDITDNSGTADIQGEDEYPWDQCIADMQAQGMDDQSAAAACASIKNRTVSHAMLFSLAKDRKEAIALIVKKVKEDKLFAYVAGKVNEMGNEITRLQILASPQAEQISSLKVAKLTAEKLASDTQLQCDAKIQSTQNECTAKVKGMELALEKANAQVQIESTARQKAEALAEDRDNTIKRMEKIATQNLQDKFADAEAIKKWKRTAEDGNEKLETLQLAHNKLITAYNKQSEDYRKSLAITLELSNKLTTANEALLAANKEKGDLEEENKKHKRLAKIIVTT